MDTTSYVTMIIIVFAIIVPAFISGLRSKKKKEKFKSEFLAIGESNGIKISEYDKWNHYAIGIDRESKKILYLNNVLNVEKVLIINLNMVRSLEVQEISRTVNTKSGNIKVLDQLKLKIKHRAKDTSEIYIEFYNSEINSIPHNEMELIGKWRKIIDLAINLTINTKSLVMH